jgi:hypothetical protein
MDDTSLSMHMKPCNATHNAKNQRNRAFLSGTKRTADRSAPQLRQNPVIAFVGLPASSNARFLGGPRLSSSTVSCSAANPSTTTASRLGVPKALMPECNRRQLLSKSANRRWSCATAEVTSSGGSSSVPTSKRKSAGSTASLSGNGGARGACKKKAHCFQNTCH